jgi:hypothetical protein
LRSDVARGATVSGKSALLVEHRLAADAVVLPDPVRPDSPELEIAERQVGFQHSTVRLPARDERRPGAKIPAILANDVRKLNARSLKEPIRCEGKAQVGVLLPIPVRGNSDETAKALFAPLQRRVRLAALERCREQVHQRTEKFALAGVESTLFAGMEDKRSVRALRAGKDDTQAADHAQLAHPERVLGGFVESQVLDHHGLRPIERLRAASRIALERKLALGAFGKGHEPIQTTFRPAVRRDDAQRLAVGLPREHGAEVDLQPFGSQRHGTVDQPRWLRLA